MVLLAIISLFRVTIAFCDLSLYGPPVLLLGYLFLKFRLIAQCLFFWFVLHRKTHYSFFNPAHYSYSHSSCQVRLLGKPPKKAHLTTNHRHISANTSKQEKRATVSTTRWVFHWHAIQNGLAINYLDAGENIKGNRLSRNKTINGISRWMHLGILFHANNVFNWIASFFSA